MTSISQLQTWELFWVNRILQGPSFVYFRPSYIKENGKYWVGQSNRTSEMNLRIFLIVLILSVAESFSLTGMMKLRRFRLRRAFKNVDSVGFIKNKRTIVTKMSSNNPFKIKNKSFAVRSSCSNCNSRGSRGSRFSLWSKRFQ